MKTLLFIFLSCIGIAGCKTESAHFDTFVQNDTTTVKGSFRYLALGDSYTIGQSVSQAESFPYQLKTQLYLKGFGLTDPKIIAVTGWTTADLIAAINQAQLTTNYDIVTLLIGVNNQFQGRSQAEYRTQFVQLLNTAIGFTNGNKLRVFVISIPDYGVTPYAANADKNKIATEIDQFNAINKDESTKAGVNYLNITDISRMAATDPSLITYDGLHPSGKMYGLWMDRLSPIVAAQLK